jgi:hypothetical protein
MISQDIQDELVELQAQVAAATPLENATTAEVKAIQLNAQNLTDDIQTALVATGTLDSWSAPSDAPTIIVGFNDIVTQATDEALLSLLRGVIGRVTSNVDQLV